MRRATPDPSKHSPSPCIPVEIDSSCINRNALRVISKLHDAGYEAYLVGGGVRDLLLGHSPKDFDIATNAHPEEVRKLFDNSRIIGRRFRIVHVYGSKGLVEVATFRAAGRAHVNQKGRIIADNTYGSIDEDAFRRDFTANALYYDPDEARLLDLVGGLQDLDARMLRVIGEPDLRFREDPARMLRAVRLSVKLDFQVEKQAEESIYRLGHLLSEVHPARLFDEIVKLFYTGFAVRTFDALREFGLFQHLFPMTEKELCDRSGETFSALVYTALQRTDERIRTGKHVTPSFLYAVFLWGPLRALVRQLELDGLSHKVAHAAAVENTVISQMRFTSIPKRLQHPMREIWDLQFRFYRKYGNSAFRLYRHPRFRAAYDFLCLRAAAGESVDRLCEWWTTFQEADLPTKRKMTNVRRGRQRKSQRGSAKRTYH